MGEDGPGAPYACKGREVGFQVGAEQWTIGAYITGDRTSKTAVVVVADGYGWRKPQARLLADEIAASGAIVCVPDIFRGNSWPEDKPTGDDLVEWELAQPGDRCLADVLSVVDTMKEGGAEKVGAVGCGWGASYVLAAAGEEGQLAACCAAFEADGAPSKMGPVTAPTLLISGGSQPPDELVAMLPGLSKDEVPVHVEVVEGVVAGETGSKAVALITDWIWRHTR